MAAVRYLAVLIGGIIAGERAVEAAHAWREWHNWAGKDPSGADAYRAFFMVNTAAALVSLGLAALIWHLLRSRTGDSAPGGGVER